jgi:hypothetical protein
MSEALPSRTPGGGRTVEESQNWSLEFIAAMANSRIALSDELMR